MGSDSQLSNSELFRAGVWHELLCKDEETNTDKFWSIKIVKNTHIRRNGRAGTEGRETLKAFGTQDEARKDAERIYYSKLRNGYRVKKPQLQVDTELIHIVQHKELERFFMAVYKVFFDFRADQECPNVFQQYRFTPNGKFSSEDGVKEKINTWIQMEGENIFYMTHHLLDDCVRQRLIPSGTYLVEINIDQSS
tara:strand:- start:219 stop:800 length:582 start_codon:yes stop_codon:yes gene_type:complete